MVDFVAIPFVGTRSWLGNHKDPKAEESPTYGGRKFERNVNGF